MRIPRSLTWCAFAFLILLRAMWPAEAEEKGFVPLFDGKTFEGWRSQGGRAKYVVETGTIVGTAVPNTANSFLCTERQYSDFILELEFRVDAGLNSGIQIRSHVFDKPADVAINSGDRARTRTIPAGRVHGYQVEIDPSARSWSGGIFDESRRGWLYELAGDKHKQARAAFKKGEWNRLRIDAVGASIKTWINGVPVADLNDGLTRSGFIALQVHGVGKNPERAGKQVRWRNVRIKELNKGSAETLPFHFDRSLHGTRATDTGLQKLKQLKNLTSLDLSDARVTDAGLVELRDLNQLTLLDLGGTRVTDAGLKQLKDLNHLTFLDLGGTEVTDNGLKELKGLNNLTTLHLYDTRVTDTGLKELKDLTNLTTLDVSRTEVADAGLKQLRELKNLTTLYLYRTGVTDAGLQELKGLKKLATLELINTGVTDAGLKVLGGFNDLNYLNLSGTRVTDAGLKELKGLNNLSTLNLFRTGVTDTGLKELKELNNLTALYLLRTQVTDAGLKELKGLKNLATLDLYRTQVTDDGLKQLKGLNKLTSLDLGGTQVTNAGLQELRNALPKCRIIK